MTDFIPAVVFDTENPDALLSLVVEHSDGSHLRVHTLNMMLTNEALGHLHAAYHGWMIERNIDVEALFGALLEPIGFCLSKGKYAQALELLGSLWLNQMGDDLVAIARDKRRGLVIVQWYPNESRWRYRFGLAIETEEHLGAEGAEGWDDRLFDGVKSATRHSQG